MANLMVLVNICGKMELETNLGKLMDLDFLGPMYYLLQVFWIQMLFVENVMELDTLYGQFYEVKLYYEQFYGFRYYLWTI